MLYNVINYPSAFQLCSTCLAGGNVSSLNELPSHCKMATAPLAPSLHFREEDKRTKGQKKKKAPLERLCLLDWEWHPPGTCTYSVSKTKTWSAITERRMVVGEASADQQRQPGSWCIWRQKRRLQPLGRLCLHQRSWRMGKGKAGKTGNSSSVNHGELLL